MPTNWYYEENHSESEFSNLRSFINLLYLLFTGDPHIAYLNFDFRSDAPIPDCLAFDFLSINTGVELHLRTTWHL